jgi:hypothetical protein
LGGGKGWGDVDGEASLLFHCLGTQKSTLQPDFTVAQHRRKPLWKSSPSSKLSVSKPQTVTNDSLRFACNKMMAQVAGHAVSGMRENNFFNLPTIPSHILSHFLGKAVIINKLKPPKVSKLPNEFSTDFPYRHLRRHADVSLNLTHIKGLSPEQQ